MPKQKKKPENKTLETLVDSLSTIVVKETSKQKNVPDKKSKYVVVRDNHRVSDVEYDGPNDDRAISERDFWMRIVSKHPDGSRVRIVEYDNKIHRVY